MSSPSTVTMGPAEPIIPGHFETKAQQNESNILGMWLFLAQEIMFFGGMFTAYFYYRMQYPDVWSEGATHLNMPLGTLNTCVLLASSVTMALSVYFTQKGRFWPLMTCMTGTMILGIAFLVVKYTEYAEKYHHGLIPVISWNPQDVHLEDPAKLEIFFVLYFLVTGMHAFHMIIGIAILGVLMVLAWKKKFGPNRYMPVEIFGFYWHFVDIVWVFLFPLIYLIEYNPGAGH